MAKIVPIVSILLALIAAGSIAYIAWELTSIDDESNESSDGAPADDD